MKVMRWVHGFSIFVLFVLIARSAFADVTPELLRSRGSCSEYVMCVASVATGPCTDPTQASDEIVMDMQGNTSITFYSTQSTAATYSCEVWSNDEGHDAASPTGDAHRVESTPLTETARVLTLAGGFSFIWIECSALSGPAIRITANVCREQGR